MSIRKPPPKYMPNAFVNRQGQPVNFLDYLQTVLQLVVVQPIGMWIAGSLGDSDFRKVLAQIDANRINGFLHLEWCRPQTGETARCLLTVANGAVKSAALRTTSVGSDLNGLTAFKKIIEYTAAEPTIVGSYFFQATDTNLILDQIRDDTMNLGFKEVKALFDTAPPRPDSLIGTSV